MAALLLREKTGLGQKIDCSLLETQVACLANIGSSFLNANTTPTRLGTAHESIVPYQSMPTKDGSIIIAIMNDNQFKKLCAVLSCPDLAEDPRYTTNPTRVKHRDSLLGALQMIFRQHSTAYWCELLEPSLLAFGPINSIPQVFQDPQVGFLLQRISSRVW